MRWCSRCAAGERSVCFGGSVSFACGSVVFEVMQPASVSASAMAAGNASARAAPGYPCGLVVLLTVFRSVRQFKVAISICSGLVASMRGPLRSSIQPRTLTRTVFQRLGLQAGPPKDALMSFQDRDRKRLRPAAAEIDIDRAAALADRQHLAFRNRESTPSGQKLRPAFGRLDDIIRFGPEAKLAGPGEALLRQKLRRAGRGRPRGRSPGQNRRHEAHGRRNARPRPG